VPRLLENLPKNISKEDQDYLKKYGERLSDSTQNAKWIGSQDDHEEHAGQSLVTRNYEVIKQWAEERGAKPATVPGTEHGRTLGVLRFNFPGFGGKDLQETSWEEWLRTFDERKLVFLFQERLKNGNQSNFFRLESPLREDA